jgi:divalent metal cation (Fe/Co/Zn/Cd) transporter
MKAARIIALLLLLAALVLAAIGFFWLAGTALPYQDPTPNQLLAQNAEVQEAQWLMVGALIVAIASAVWLWKTRTRSK